MTLLAALLSRMARRPMFAARAQRQPLERFQMLQITAFPDARN